MALEEILGKHEFKSNNKSWVSHISDYIPLVGAYKSIADGLSDIVKVVKNDKRDEKREQMGYNGVDYALDGIKKIATGSLSGLIDVAVWSGGLVSVAPYLAVKAIGTVATKKLAEWFEPYQEKWNESDKTIHKWASVGADYLVNASSTLGRTGLFGASALLPVYLAKAGFETAIKRYAAAAFDSDNKHVWKRRIATLGSIAMSGIAGYNVAPSSIETIENTFGGLFATAYAADVIDLPDETDDEIHFSRYTHTNDDSHHIAVESRNWNSSNSDLRNGIVIDGNSMYASESALAASPDSHFIIWENDGDIIDLGTLGENGIGHIYNITTDAEYVGIVNLTDFDADGAYHAEILGSTQVSYSVPEPVMPTGVVLDSSYIAEIVQQQPEVFVEYFQHHDNHDNGAVIELPDGTDVYIPPDICDDMDDIVDGNDNGDNGGGDSGGDDPADDLVNYLNVTNYDTQIVLEWQDGIPTNIIPLEGNPQSVVGWIMPEGNGMGFSVNDIPDGAFDSNLGFYTSGDNTWNISTTVPDNLDDYAYIALINPDDADLSGEELGGGLSWNEEQGMYQIDYKIEGTGDMPEIVQEYINELSTQYNGEGPITLAITQDDIDAYIASKEADNYVADHTGESNDSDYVTEPDYSSDTTDSDSSDPVVIETNNDSIDALVEPVDTGSADISENDSQDYSSAPETVDEPAYTEPAVEEL